MLEAPCYPLPRQQAWQLPPALQQLLECPTSHPLHRIQQLLQLPSPPLPQAAHPHLPAVLATTTTASLFPLPQLLQLAPTLPIHATPSYHQVWEQPWEPITTPPSKPSWLVCQPKGRSLGKAQPLHQISMPCWLGLAGFLGQVGISKDLQGTTDLQILGHHPLMNKIKRKSQRSRASTMATTKTPSLNQEELRPLTDLFHHHPLKIELFEIEKM